VAPSSTRRCKTLSAASPGIGVQAILAAANPIRAKALGRTQSRNGGLQRPGRTAVTAASRPETKSRITRVRGANAASGPMTKTAV
jgi:hypothetical protein